MHLHDEITRITDMESLNRVDLHGAALADLSVVTREMAFVPVESALGQSVGSRLPTESISRVLSVNVTGKDPDGKSVTMKIEGKTKAKLQESLKMFKTEKGKGFKISKIKEEKD